MLDFTNYICKNLYIFIETYAKELLNQFKLIEGEYYLRFKTNNPLAELMALISILFAITDILLSYIINSTDITTNKILWLIIYIFRIWNLYNAIFCISITNIGFESLFKDSIIIKIDNTKIFINSYLRICLSILCYTQMCSIFYIIVFIFLFF